MNDNDIKHVLNKHAIDNKQIERIEFITLTREQIRHYIDIDYNGDDREVMRVVYNPNLYACDKYVLDWRYTRPDELFNSLEI